MKKYKMRIVCIDYKNLNRHCLACEYGPICEDFDINFPLEGNNANDCLMWTWDCDSLGELKYAKN